MERGIVVTPRVSLELATKARDFKTLLGIQEALASKTYAAYVKEDGLSYLLRNGTVSKVKVGREVAGLVAFLPDKEDRKIVEHTNLAILPQYQHSENRVGSAAFNLDLEIIKARGFEYVWGVVHPRTIGSLIIVRNSGFECVGRADNYYGDKEPRLIFEKRLIGGEDTISKVSLVKVNDVQDLDTVRMINSTLKSSMHTGFLDENDMQDVFKNGTIFLIKVGGGTVGTVSFRPDRENSGTALLRNLEILQEYQGRRIGTGVTQLLLSTVKELGFKKARTRVRPEKDMARRILKKLGFEEVGNDDSFGDGVVRLIMEKRL